MIVGGLDPGNTGAIGIYDGGREALVDVWDLPNYQMIVNKTKRWRINEDGLFDQLTLLKDLYDMRLLVIESVMGMPKQSAPRAFQFGDTYGVIRTTARWVGIPVHYASPTVWKLQEKVPRHEASIVAKANKEFPEHVKLFTGRRGGFMHDRAEAGFLARYAWRKIWPALQPRIQLRKAIKAVPR